MRKLTIAEQAEYDRLTKNAEQLKLDLAALTSTTYGYARVSTKAQAKDGNSLDVQRAALEKAGAKKIFTDAFTGTTTERPELEKLLKVIEPGDTIVVRSELLRSKGALYVVKGEARVEGELCASGEFMFMIGK